MGTPVLLLAPRTKTFTVDDMNDTKQDVRHVVTDTFTLFFLFLTRNKGVLFFLLSIQSCSQVY